MPEKILKYACTYVSYTRPVAHGFYGAQIEHNKSIKQFEFQN